MLIRWNLAASVDIIFDICAAQPEASLSTHHWTKPRQTPAFFFDGSDRSAKVSGNASDSGEEEIQIERLRRFQRHLTKARKARGVRRETKECECKK